MNKKRIPLIALICMLCLLVCACSSNGAATPAASPEGAGSISGETPAAGTAGTKSNIENLKLCFLAQANNTFQASLRNAINDKCKELEIKVDTFNADNDVSTQLTQIESAIASKYDAIILCAVDSVGVSPGAKMVKDAGIPLVCVNMLVDDENVYDVYVGSDDVDAGKIQGEWLKEKTGGKCEIGIIHVPMGCSAEIGRSKGFQESMLDTSPEAVVVAQADGKAQIDEGMRITEDWLQTYPNIDVIVAQNDAMGLGAMQAVMGIGRKDEILICGVDGDQDAIKAILDGTYDMTVFQNAKGQGACAVEVAVGLIHGESFDKTIMIPFEAITADNAQHYLEP